MSGGPKLVTFMFHVQFRKFFFFFLKQGEDCSDEADEWEIYIGTSPSMSLAAAWPGYCGRLLA